VIAHVGALPLEEVLPVLTGAGSGLLALRAWMTPRVRRRREPGPSTAADAACFNIHRSRALDDRARASSSRTHVSREPAESGTTEAPHAVLHFGLIRGLHELAPERR
jgi:hypothetical protein